MSIGKNGVGIQWQSIIQGAILFLAVGGAFWALAYNPIQTDIRDLKSQISDLRGNISSGDERSRNEFQRHTDIEENKYLTQKEHTEFKNRTDNDIKKINEALETIRKETETRRQALESKVEKEAETLRKEIEARRVEVATKSEVQATSQATRLEMLAEVKRLDQREDGDMKRQEFEAWKYERDKTISSIQDRMNRFSEALDAMYTKILQLIQKP